MDNSTVSPHFYLRNHTNIDLGQILEQMFGNSLEVHYLQHLLKIWSNKRNTFVKFWFEEESVLLKSGVCTLIFTFMNEETYNIMKWGCRQVQCLQLVPQKPPNVCGHDIHAGWILTKFHQWHISESPYLQNNDLQTILLHPVYDGKQRWQ